MTGRAEEAGVRRGATILLGAVLAVAVGFRLWLIAAIDFPINDGALFLEFVRATAATFPKLPVTVNYNASSLPFAYPPLSFWLGALAVRLGFDPLGLVRVLPILMNIVYVLLIALLLLKSGRTRLFTALALIFFYFSLRSFEWLVMGGGLSRGLGSLFFAGALLAATVPGPRGNRELPVWRMALAGAFVGGAILSHLEWGVLAAASFVTSRAFGARSIREFILHCAIAGLTALVLVLPWFLFIYSTHSLEPFLAAGGTSSWSFRSSVINLVGLVRPAIANPFILLGGIVLLLRRDLWWFAFVLLCVFLTPRHGPTPLALPLGIFAAQGVITSWNIARRFMRPRFATAALAAAVALVTTAKAYHQFKGTDGRFQPLPSELREAMAWVKESHPGARFAILNTAPWYYDSSAEWFPSLAQARSVTTVQGTEWLPHQAFSRANTIGAAVKLSGSCAELFERLRPFGPTEFIWAETMMHCFAGPGFAPVYRNSRVTIYRVNPARVAERDRGALSSDRLSFGVRIALAAG